MPSSMNPSEHKLLKTDISRWSHFLSRLTAWNYRMNSLHPQVFFHGYIKHHIHPVLTCVWLVDFLGSWRRCYLPRQDFSVRLETSVCNICFHLSFKGIYGVVYAQIISGRTCKKITFASREGKIENCGTGVGGRGTLTFHYMIFCITWTCYCVYVLLFY